eukprot:828781_1
MIAFDPIALSAQSRGWHSQDPDYTSLLKSRVNGGRTPYIPEFKATSLVHSLLSQSPRFKFARSARNVFEFLTSPIFQPTLSIVKMANSQMSKDFFELIKKIGEAKSKQEEDAIVNRELRVLKVKMSAKNVSSRRMKEYLIRMLYVEMLGHPFPSGYIHAIKTTHNGTLYERRVGYLTCGLCLHSDHELMLLLVGGLQTDLQSDNHLEVATALIICSKLIGKDTIPALLPLVVKLLEHTQANIRKKAVMVLQHFYMVDPESLMGVHDKVRLILCDKDPAVMGAVLNVLGDMIAFDVESCKDLVPSFVSIAKQITEHRLPREFDYHRLPAPWIQIKLLKILRQLGSADKAASEGMYEVLSEVMRRADTGTNIGYAIIYECVRTVTAIYPNNTLLEEAAKCTSRFITSENHNLKYLGITVLANIVQVDPRYAAEHQAVVIDCLEDSDETLRRQTLDLLFRMTNPANVTVVAEKLLESLKATVDVYLRTELVSKITQLAERYAPDNSWYIQTMNMVFEAGGDLVQPEVAHNVIRMITEGAAEDEEDDIAQCAVHSYLDLIDKPMLSDVLLMVISCILGEFGHMSETHTRLDIIHKLWDIIESRTDGDCEVRAWALTAIMKLLAHIRPIPVEVCALLEKYQTSAATDLQQRSHEILHLTSNESTMSSVLPVGTNAEEIHIDSSLQFLDPYIIQALGAGAREYQAPSDDDVESIEPESHHSELLVEQYPQWTGSQADMSSAAAVSTAAPDHMGIPGLDLPELAGPSGAEAFASSESALPEVSGPWGPVIAPPEPVSGELNVDQLQAESSILATGNSPFSGESLEDRDHMLSVYSDEPGISENAEPASLKPRVLTQREKMAASLFAGVDPSTPTIAPATGPGSFRRRKKPARGHARQTSAASSEQSAASVDTGGLLPMDLMDGGMMATGASGVQSSTTPDVDDLLSIVSAEVINPQSSEPAKIDSAVNMFSDLSMGAGESKEPLDLMDFGVTTKDSESNGIPIKYGFQGVSKQLQQKLDGLKKAPSVDEVLVSDDNIRISYFKICAPGQTVVTLFTSNTHAHALSSLRTSLKSPATGIALQFDPPSAEPPVKMDGRACSVLAKLAARATSAQFIGVTCQSPSLFSKTPIAGQVSYSLPNGEPQTVSFSVKIDCSDMIRPFVCQTAQFGQMWQQFPQEAVIKGMSTQCLTPMDLESILSSRFNLHHVETIGHEVIAAGTTIGDRSIVLLHTKLVGSKVDVLARSRRKDYVD